MVMSIFGSLRSKGWFCGWNWYQSNNGSLIVQIHWIKVWLIFPAEGRQWNLSGFSSLSTCSLCCVNKIFVNFFDFLLLLLFGSCSRPWSLQESATTSSATFSYCIICPKINQNWNWNIGKKWFVNLSLSTFLFLKLIDIF